MPATILVVEDEADLTLMMRYNLEAEGFRVAVAHEGEEATALIREALPDLILLDWMLPGLSGIELCRRWRSREETARVPIIMITARGEEEERVRGLATGADDYVVKPFSTPELVARVKAMLRRAKPEVLSTVLKCGDIELDRETHRVHRKTREVRLGPTEFRLLEFLMSSPGRVSVCAWPLTDHGASGWTTSPRCRRIAVTRKLLASELLVGVLLRSADRLAGCVLRLVDLRGVLVSGRLVDHVTALLDQVGVRAECVLGLVDQS